ncbi:hypothetical protein BHU72_07435 [Desulfuribacillus stibiiarsenatis]|uniref:HTH tetR-type domain-containing protein n=1 Tax=Desulfuribacillus stibiiarsenatis TaxID=1390249 RepID=A0A1E5L4J0_9FIRM|nr:TetR/AcrR family transcriptional regulator [Desulfuribacillus stibiiarsenatis]OEH85011.1 hypothetical protein BHU72_07435 [Desulfuribacillus stibiiarsenatis]
MPKTDGDITKKRILQVAEKLFSEHGFDGTGVDKIAKAAGVNKGSLYYHFKDKNDIIESLFQKIMNEIQDNINLLPKGASQVKEVKIEDKIKSEIQYLNQKKQILSILLMETLKSGQSMDSFIKCMEMVIKKELHFMHEKEKVESLSEEDLQRYMVHEFFTGIMPVISFVTLKDKWCNYFNCDQDKVLEYFMESFIDSHIKSHRL